eukprot:7261131-Prorocentrum_lima.AAC.1
MASCLSGFPVTGDVLRFLLVDGDCVLQMGMLGLAVGSRPYGMYALADAELFFLLLRNVAPG